VGLLEAPVAVLALQAQQELTSLAQALLDKVLLVELARRAQVGVAVAVAEVLAQ